MTIHGTIASIPVTMPFTVAITKQNYGVPDGSAAGATAATSSSYGNPPSTTPGAGLPMSPIKRRKLVMAKPGSAKA